MIRRYFRTTNKVPHWAASVFPTMKPYVKYSETYPLGADYVGRDLFSRIVYGALYRWRWRSLGR